MVKGGGFLQNGEVRGEEVAIELEGLGVAGAAVEEQGDVDVATLELFFGESAESNFMGSQSFGSRRLRSRKRWLTLLKVRVKAEPSSVADCAEAKPVME